MSSSLQTTIALTVVGIAIALMIYFALRKDHSSGCGGGGGCSAVSPELKKLRARLKR